MEISTISDNRTQSHKTTVKQGEKPQEGKVMLCYSFKAEEGENGKMQ